MTYEILISDRASKQLKKLPLEIQQRILNSLERIRARPEDHLKRLVGDPAYSLRVGDYRVLIDLEKDKLILLVIKVGHRKNIYK